MLTKLRLKDRYGITGFGMIVALVLLVAAITVPVVWLTVKADNECKAAGGQMVGTGHYTTIVTYVKVGTSSVPNIQTIEDTTCKLPGTR